MKSLKKTALALTFICTATLTSVAQVQTDKKQIKTEMKQKFDDLKKQLNLTDEQAAKFRDINKNFAGQISEIRQPLAERKAKREKIIALKTAKDSEIKAILSDEQYLKYQKILEDRKAGLIRKK